MVHHCGSFCKLVFFDAHFTLSHLLFLSTFYFLYILYALFCLEVGYLCLFVFWLDGELLIFSKKRKPMIPYSAWSLSSLLPKLISIEGESFHNFSSVSRIHHFHSKSPPIISANLLTSTDFLKTLSAIISPPPFLLTSPYFIHLLSWLNFVSKVNESPSAG